MKPIFDMKPLFRAGFYGKTGSGKTWTLCQWLIALAKRKDPSKRLFQKILWVAPDYSANQGGPLDKVRALWGEHFVHFPPEKKNDLDIMCKELHAKKWPFLIVLDDLMATHAKDPFYSQLYTAGRHRGASVIGLDQRVFASSRTRRLQVDYVLLFNLMGHSEVSSLARQVCSTKHDAALLVKAYKACVEDDPHGFIMLDFKTRDKRLKVRHGWDKSIPELSHII